MFVAHSDWPANHSSPESFDTHLKKWETLVDYVCRICLLNPMFHVTSRDSVLLLIKLGHAYTPYVSCWNPLCCWTSSLLLAWFPHCDWLSPCACCWFPNVPFFLTHPESYLGQSWMGSLVGVCFLQLANDLTKNISIGLAITRISRTWVCSFFFLSGFLHVICLVFFLTGALPKSPKILFGFCFCWFSQSGFSFFFSMTPFQKSLCPVTNYLETC